MAKVTGATLEFWYGGVEYPVESVSFDGQWDVLDATDSAVGTPATAFVVNRAKRTSRVEAFLDAAHGATLAGNNLVAGTQYIVTLGNVTETVVAHTYPVGKCFTSDGTGVATASNQVAPLGAKLPGKNIVCSVGGANTCVTAMRYTEAYGDFDATDSGSSGDSTESVTGRATRTSTLELILLDTVADLVEASPTAVAIVLTFGSGLTITGSGIFTKKSVQSLAKGDMVKATYEIQWTGPVTEALANMLPMATSTATIVRWKGWGAATQKQVSGNAIVMGKTIEADVNSLCKVSYDLNWSGAVTETEYA